MNWFPSANTLVLRFIIFPPKRLDRYERTLNVVKIPNIAAALLIEAIFVGDRRF